MSTPRLPNETYPNPTPTFYIIDGDVVQSQLLANFLEKKFKTDCFCHLGISLGDVVALKPARLTICLFHWAESEDTATIKKRLNPGGTPCPPHILPVLCNVDPASNIEKLAGTKALRGIFYEGESFESFIEGLKAILRGEVRLKRHSPKHSIASSVKNTPSPQSPLTSREIELLRQVASGANNRAIAARLSISPHTVKTHLYNIYKKIGVPNRLQASLWAIANLKG